MTKKRNAGEGSIFQRSDGRWCAALTVGSRNGRQVRKSFYGRTALEVQEKLLDARDEARHGIDPSADSSQRLKQFLAAWLGGVRAHVRVRSYEAYRGAVERHVIPALGDIRLSKLTPQHVQQFLADRLGAGLHPRTVGFLRGTLAQALKQAVEWSMIPRNAAALVKSPKAPRTVIKPLTPEQAHALLDAAQGEPLEAMLQLTLTLGLRRGEVVGLMWEDIDFEKSQLSIRRTIGRARAGIIVQEPKTASSRRTLTLPSGLVAALRAHRKRQLEQRLLIGRDWHDTGYVFTTSIGTPLDPSDPGDDLDRLLRKAGLPHIRFHDLRHSAATFALIAGVHPKVVAEILGHTKVGMTLDVYSHLLPGMQADAASRVENLLTSEKAAKTAWN
jgi:integrase